MANKRTSNDTISKLTSQLSQRDAELAIINSIQEGLAAKHDFQSIVDTVGDTLREIVQADTFGIGLYDKKSQLVNYPYGVSRGKRIILPPSPPGGISGYMLKTGKTMVINRNFASELQKYGSKMMIDDVFPKSGVYVPIVVGTEAIGGVSAQNYEREDAYPDSIVGLLEIVARHMGVALENARLFDETQRLLKETEQRNAELAIINSVQAALASKLDMQAIYEMAGEKIRGTFNAQVVTIAIYERSTQLMHGRYYFEDGKVLPGITLPAFGFRKHVVESHKPIVVNDEMSRWMKEYDNPVIQGSQPKSAIFVPMMAGNEAIGVVSLQNNDHENAFSESDLRLLSTLADSMSVALENARLFDETQRLLKETEQRAQELAILNSVGEAMARTLDVQTVTRLVGDKVRDIFAADSTIIMLLNKQTNQIHVPYEYDKNEGGYIDYVEPFPLGTGLSSKVILSRQPLMLGTLDEELANGAYFPPEIIAKGEGFFSESWLGVPIITNDQVLGLVALADARPHAFHENQLRLLQILSSNMGVAIENARLFDETQHLLKETEQRNAELAIINSVQDGLASKLDMQEIYDLVGDKICEIFNAQVVMISTYDRETDTMEHRYAIEQGERVYAPGHHPVRGFRTQIVQTRKPVLVSKDVAEQAARLGQPTLPGTITPKTWLGVPMLVGNQVTGILSLQNISQENAFTAADVRLLETFAASMSIALENARLWEQEKMYRKALQRELDIGREIQAGFLPEVIPQVKGWEIAAALMSAREVAGDFYDIFQLPDGKIGLVIADVCDKGVGAALFMTLFRSLIRITANQGYYDHTGTAGDPQSTREQIQHAIYLTNNYIAETHGKSGMFATLFFGVLDPRDGKLVFINGGHEPPLIVRSGNVCGALQTTGPAVGVIKNCLFEACETQLAPEEMLFAFTDGAPEAKDPHGEFYGRERLFDTLRRDPGSAHELVKAMETELQEYIGGATQFDDITLLAVKRVMK